MATRPEKRRQKVKADIKCARHKKIVRYLKACVAEASRVKGLLSHMEYVDKIEKSTQIATISYREIRRAAAACKNKKITLKVYDLELGNTYSTPFPIRVGLYPIRKTNMRLRTWP